MAKKKRGKKAAGNGKGDSNVTITFPGQPPIELTDDQLSEAARQLSQLPRRDVTKIGYDGERVRVEWEQVRASGVDEYKLSCCDHPHATLTDALGKLREHVATICCLSESYCREMEIRSVSFSYGGDERVMGATITALKKLSTATAPLVLNTPHLASASYNADQDEGIGPLLSEDAVEALEELQVEAMRYVDGWRSQLELFDPKPATVEQAAPEE